MFRVNTVDEGSHVLITIDGQLSAAYVEFVDHCCGRASAAGKPVQLLLRDVSLVDEVGCRLLRRLAANGVCLRANGLHNSLLIRECNSAARRCESRLAGSASLS